MNIALRICALVFNIYVLSISGSSYIGLPERSWTDASTACSLQSKEKIESGEMTNFTSTYIKGVSKVWIGTWVKYSYWAAFIGCGSGFTTETPANSSSTKATLRECLLHCSDNPFFSHIAVQNSQCRCLPGIESANNGTDCRRKCDTEYESLCDSGHSAMLFTFVKDFRVNPSEIFLGDECAYVNPADMTYNAAPCKEKLLYSCKRFSNSLKTAHWDTYQEKCREQGEHVLYDGWYTGPNPKLEPHWTPIFRVHKTYNVGHPSGKSACLSWLQDQENSKDLNSKKFVREEDCLKHHPFLCVKSGNRPNEHWERPRDTEGITISIYIIIGNGVLITVLILVITFGYFKYRNKIVSYKKETLIQNLAGNNISSYTEFINNQNEEESAYRELNTDANNISLPNQDSHNQVLNANAPAMVQNEQTDCDGYELPELHYHTILEET